MVGGVVLQAVAEGGEDGHDAAEAWLGVSRDSSFLVVYGDCWTCDVPFISVMKSAMCNALWKTVRDVAER